MNLGRLKSLPRISACVGIFSVFHLCTHICMLVERNVFVQSGIVAHQQALKLDFRKNILSPKSYRQPLCTLCKVFVMFLKSIEIANERLFVLTEVQWVSFVNLSYYLQSFSFSKLFVIIVQMNFSPLIFVELCKLF